MSDLEVRINCSCARAAEELEKLLLDIVSGKRKVRKIQSVWSDVFVNLYPSSE